LVLSSVVVKAETLRGALEELIRRHPVLHVHLFDENGAFRRHVLCFHNEENTGWLDGLDQPVGAGDTITIIQAVSGGSGPRVRWRAARALALRLRPRRSPAAPSRAWGQA
jgi:molybdopterin converting factor small subunit